MSGSTLKNRIINECIHNNIEVASVEDKGELFELV